MCETKYISPGSLSVVALTAAPRKLLAGVGSRFRVNTGFMVDAAKSRTGKAINLLEGDTFTTKVSTQDTDGYIYESTRSKEGGCGNYLYTHLANR